MIKYNHYNIKESDNFNEFDFPNVTNELELLKEGLSHLPGTHKGDIVISYLKDHAVSDLWTNDNPQVTQLISSGSFVISNLEWLFESCRTHKRFSDEFEEYIKKTINQMAN
jgi:hypothetical protein